MAPFCSGQTESGCRYRACLFTEKLGYTKQSGTLISIIGNTCVYTYYFISKLIYRSVMCCVYFALHHQRSLLTKKLFKTHQSLTLLHRVTHSTITMNML